MIRKTDEAVRITSALPAKSVGISSRQTRYLISMGVRTLCFVLAIVTTGTLRWIFLAGAFFLPYFAVVIANSGSRPDTGAPEPFDPTERLALPGSYAAGAIPPPQPAPDVEPGEVISR
jgi:hypothetical protein